MKQSELSDYQSIGEDHPLHSIADGEVTCPICDEAFSGYRGYAYHYSLKDDGGHGIRTPLIELCGADALTDLYSKYSTCLIADLVGVVSETVRKSLDFLEIERRDTSEAARNMWARRSDEWRAEWAEQVSKTQRRRVQNGENALKREWEENPEKQRKIAKKAAPLGPPAREKHGLEGVTGPNHHSWKGGRHRYGEGWTEDLREGVRERQNRRCAGCGTGESENGRRLSVHHIQKARSMEGLPAEVRHADDRLVALCRKCHPVWESMAPLRPQTAFTD